MMLPRPQVAQDLPAMMDPVISYASREGEHRGVMMKNVDMHRLVQHQGDVWRGAHVAKINAFHGGPRTFFSQTSRYSAETTECHLGYTVSIISLSNNWKYLMNKYFLRQLGSQSAEAIARDVDRKLLGTFATATSMTDRSGNAILHNNILTNVFALDAAADDSESPITIISPVAHIEDLVKELTTMSSTTAVITRPLTDPAAEVATRDRPIMIRGVSVQQARNAPKFGSDGYTGVYRKTAIKFVSAPVMEREVENHPRYGPGAKSVIMRKWWGFVVPSWALRNWFRAVKAQMPIGGQ